MFGNSKLRSEIALMRAEMETMQQTIKSLKERVSEVEAGTMPFRIGDFPEFAWHPHWKDPRPVVTMHGAIAIICEHLKLRFTRTPARPEVIGLEKIK